MRCVALLVLVFLSSCTPAPETRGLRLVTIDTPDTGLSLRELPPQALRSVGLPYGLAIVKAGALAERAGLRIGDVVYGVNQQKVKNLEEFNRLLAQQPGGTLGLLVRRGRSDFYVALDFASGAPNGAPRPPSKDTLLRT
jgi:S1-C subfamily serine protease